MLASRRARCTFGAHMRTIRRYLFAIVILMIIGGIVFSYQKFKRMNTPVSPILMAVPEGSALVLETRNAMELWEKLTHTSVIWEDLKLTDEMARIDAIGQRIDSVLHADNELKTLMRNRKAIAVVAPSGAQSYSLLFAVNTPPSWKDLKIENLIKKAAGSPVAFTQRDYENTALHTANIDGGPAFYWARKSGILLLSTAQIPVESALRNIDAPVNLPADPQFNKVGKTAGLYAHANVYVDYAQWGAFVASLLNERGQRTPFFDHPVAGWSALDLTVLSDEMMLNGFVHVADSSKQYFSIFADQKGRPTDDLTRILPANTAYYLFYGLSHFPTFLNNYKALLREQQAFFSYDQRIEAFNQRIDGNVEELCGSWIENELAVFITEPSLVSYDQLAYLAIESTDTDRALSHLKTLSRAVGQAPDSLEMAGYTVYDLDLANAYGMLLGAPFDGFEAVVATAIDDYIVLAQSRSAMRNLINFFDTGNTLGNDENYASFASNLGKRSNLLLYSGISRSPDLYAPFLTDEGTARLEQHLETVRNFEGFAYQLVEGNDDLFYNNIYLRHNPVYTQESGAFWELALDTAVSYGPQLVLNHYTESREILVQDVTNTLHLISNTGKVLWSRPVDGQILGKVQQIDLYKNNKLQLLFNTRQRLYLLDRNGKDVTDYPVKLPATASAPLGLFDYDNSRDYRILIPCSDRELRMYDGDGTVVGGWKADQTDALVRDKPEHLRLGTRDYIFAADESGKVYLLNRRGKTRHRVKATLEARSENPLFITEGKNIKNTALLYTDTAGNLVTLGFDNAVTKTQLIDPQPHRFAATDLNGDARLELILTTAKGVQIFDSEGDTECRLDGEAMLHAPVVYRENDERHWVGVLSGAEESIYLVNTACERYSDFPFFARGAFTIGDINKDGVTNLVAIGEPNTLYTYNLD